MPTTRRTRKPAAARRGRPPKAAADRFTFNVFTRLTTETGAALVAIAEAAGLKHADVGRRMIEDAIAAGWSLDKSLRRRAREEG